MVIAEVTFLGPDKGGRSTCPRSGYHPQIALDGEYTSCAIENLGGEAEFAFDTPIRVSLRFLFADHHPDVFSVGDSIRFYEGSHLVAHGTILERG